MGLKEIATALVELLPGTKLVDEGTCQQQIVRPDGFGFKLDIWNEWDTHLTVRGLYPTAMSRDLSIDGRGFIFAQTWTPGLSGLPGPPECTIRKDREPKKAATEIIRKMLAPYQKVYELAQELAAQEGDNNHALRTNLDQVKIFYPRLELVDPAALQTATHTIQARDSWELEVQVRTNSVDLEVPGVSVETACRILALIWADKQAKKETE